MSKLLDAIVTAAAEAPSRTAIDDGRNTVLYHDLPSRVTRLADSIRQALGQDRRPVGIMLDNGIDWVLADLALLAEKRPCIPLPPFFTAEQIEAVLSDAGAVAVIERSGIVRRDAATRPVPPGTAKITYTSGSTGQPKGICLDDATMLATARAIVERFGRGMAGRHLPLLPLGVLLENVAGLYAILLAGGTYVPRDARTLGLANPFAPDLTAMVAAISEVEATSLILVPELLAGLVGVMEATGITLPSLGLVAVGGARVPIDLLTRAAKLGLPVVQGYGLTECGSVVSIETLGEMDRGTTGKPLGHVAVSLAADGEIMVAGVGHLGTVGGLAATNPIATGDVGMIDREGRLSIIGRKSSMLITGHGRNVAPEWIEEVLRGQPGVAQAFVFGDGDAALSAVLVSYGRDGDLAEAVAAANATLPAYARIAQWRPTDRFTAADGTLTTNGRLRRTRILERLDQMTDIPFFQRLVLRTKPAREAMLAIPQFRAGLAGQIGRDTYIAYLAQAYYHVSHTVPLMRETRAGLKRSPLLIDALDEYIEEETGHEYWILDDIRAAGGDVDAVVADGPSPATKAMVDHAYATIRDGNPAAFFGMVFVLEGTSIAFAQQGADAVRGALDLPPEAFRYLTSHGALDAEHMAFFERLMNRIDDPADQEAIIAMANDIFRLFGAMFAAIPMDATRAAA